MTSIRRLEPIVTASSVPNGTDDEVCLLGASYGTARCYFELPAQRDENSVSDCLDHYAPIALRFEQGGLPMSVYRALRNLVTACYIRAAEPVNCLTTVSDLGIQRVQTFNAIEEAILELLKGVASVSFARPAPVFLGDDWIPPRAPVTAAIGDGEFAKLLDMWD